MFKLKKEIILAGLGAAFLYYQKGIWMYGTYSRKQIEDHARHVVEVLGGGEAAYRLLLETVAAETDMGNAIDTTWDVGVGLTQFDPIGFEDTIARTRKERKELVRKSFGLDLDVAVIQDLRWNPLFALVMTRLKYMLVPDPIPTTKEGRAAYWKKWYNSTLGKGTPEKYIALVDKHYGVL